MSHDGEGEGEADPKKSERKRQREKQRRTDLSNAFDELATVLGTIEPDDISGKKRRKKSIGESGDGDGDTAGMTRLDLVVRTIDILKKIQADNEELRKDAPREKSSEQEVLVMVPTLSAVTDSTENLPLAAPYHPYYPPAMSGQQLVTDQQSDQQSEQGQSQKHLYTQPYQQQYHQHYLQQHHPYHFPNGREQSPPQQQEYPSIPGPFYAGIPPGHPYGNGWGSDPGQYSNPIHGARYAQYPPIKSRKSHSQDEDE